MISNEAFIECVPNFSEGRNISTINAITEAIGSVDGVRVLHVDRGEAANRTVITFVGRALDVAEAAFRAVRCASKLIDMRQHQGEHPRIGATDVLPLIPLKNITLEECAELARSLAERIYEELCIPTYCYEASAYRPEHVNLADSGVDLTCYVYTKTAEDNYYALSEIRENLLARFGENELNFAFPHVEVTGSLNQDP